MGGPAGWIKHAVLCLMAICPLGYVALTGASDENVAGKPVGPDRYLGSFRVPRDDGSGRPADPPRFQYSFGGNLAAADGQTLWLSTHERHRFVGKIAIPAPVRPSSPTAFQELPFAKTLAPAIDITEGLRAPDVQGTDRSMILSDAIVEGSQLRWVFHDYYNVSQKRYRVFGIFHSETETADGPFGLIDAAREPIRDQVSGRYLTAIPRNWASRLQATVASGGGGLAGQKAWGAGPSLYAFTPPERDADPYTTFLEAKPLLLYPFDDEQPVPARRALENWNRACRPYDAVWIGDTVVFAVCWGRGAIWYGEAEGPDGQIDWHVKDKGYHAAWYELQLLFYRAEDLMEVAEGKAPPWKPRPFAAVTIPHLMGADRGAAQVSPISLSWDPGTERLYLIQGLADRSRSEYDRHPVVHVYDLRGMESPADWIAALERSSAREKQTP